MKIKYVNFLKVFFIFLFLITFLTQEGWSASYIKFQGVDGEAEDKDHATWTDVLSLDHHSLLSGAAMKPGLRGEMVVVMSLDKSFSKLQQRFKSRTPTMSVIIHDPPKIITLKNVWIKSISKASSKTVKIILQYKSLTKSSSLKLKKVKKL